LRWFHFGSIEQDGSSLYLTRAQKVSSVEVPKILLSIGGGEIAHFLEWVDFSGNSVQPPLAPLTDPTNGLTFPNFDVTVNPLLQDKPDIPGCVRVYQPESAALRADPANLSGPDRCGGRQLSH